MLANTAYWTGGPNTARELWHRLINNHQGLRVELTRENFSSNPLVSVHTGILQYLVRL